MVAFASAIVCPAFCTSSTSAAMADCSLRRLCRVSPFPILTGTEVNLADGD
jgi:hypothetical protein